MQNRRLDPRLTVEQTVIAEAKGKSADNPTLFAFLPTQHKTELTNAIEALEAARTTLQKNGSLGSKLSSSTARSTTSDNQNQGSTENGQQSPSLATSPFGHGQRDSRLPRWAMGSH